jgi:hypothetical protein
MIENQTIVNNGRVKLFGMSMDVAQLRTVATISVAVNVVILANWLLGKYFNIHVFDMFGGATTAEV